MLNIIRILLSIYIILSLSIKREIERAKKESYMYTTTSTYLKILFIVKNNIYTHVLVKWI